MDLKDMLMQAAGIEDDGRERMTDRQEVAALRKITEARYAPKTQFKMGEVIVHKYPDRAGVKQGEKPHLFIRYLEKTFRPIEHVDGLDVNEMFSQAMTLEADCIYACLSRGTYCEFMGDSRDWMHHPDFTASRSN
jgi:hypothetical protein